MKTPLPLLFSYNDTQQFLSALSPEVRDVYSYEITRLFDSSLPPIVSWGVLSVAIGISPHFINSIINNKDKYYRTFPIAKGKGKKVRVIESPKVGLKIIQSWIAHHLALNDKVPMSDSAYAFIPGKNGIYEAASKHCRAKWVLSIDLRDFFHSINLDKVIDSLCTIGYNFEQSKKIADIVTYKARLPQGAPSSPVLSNIVFKKTDDAINVLISNKDIVYTRYADDLTFSSEDLTVDVECLKKDIIKLLESEHWVIATEKLKISKLPNRLKVHGFLVHDAQPRLTKGYRNKLRTYEYLLRNGKVTEVDLNRVRGHVSYGKYIDKLNKRD
ncbi:reverse transcriptase family protein [Serratia ficaria]|uniref:reverse transcriptase family protein n=1 Tax=Serratia ficaria TaxID=61651 RepID=UPI002177B31E|nr:reverse transcriptase family protein [Serratia ficaria]CAI0834030.1 Retron-type reverse transcriptase [Serratia ficaria]CAI1698236.1 Retron-type reverse transcriptase [Serratia ficaria]